MNSLFSNGFPGLDSVSNWNEAAPAEPAGFTFFNTVGSPPSTDGTTNINAPIVPVIVSLLNADGSTAFVLDPTADVQPVLHSPVFQRSTYTSSSNPTQFTDAVQRAEFFGQEQKNWHTELSPSIKAPLQLSIPSGHWFAGTAPDGSTFALVDENTFNNEMFPPTFPVDNSTVLGQAELNGDITTQDISTFQFENVFLYQGGNPTHCCVLGYHTFDEEPGVASNGNRLRAYVMNFNSWTSPDLFRADTADITPLSHEMSETFNDPFVTAFGDNVTPWWKAPNGVCQNNRETGDVIEGLPSQVFPMTMHGFTYHPQNEALLQWFEFQQPPSTALDGAFSYPDETVLTGPSATQNPHCAP